MPLTSSQGVSLIAGARKISMKASRSNTGANKLDSSTLALANGSVRTYEDGLVDNGPNGGGDGIVVTVTAEGLGSPPGTGSGVQAFGKTCYCTESSIDSNVGELQAWSASYTSDYDPGT